MQYPVLRHGDNVVPDSSAIFDYLLNTYPTQMSLFQPPDSTTCVPTSLICSSMSSQPGVAFTVPTLLPHADCSNTIHACTCLK